MDKLKKYKTIAILLIVIGVITIPFFFGIGLVVAGIILLINVNKTENVIDSLPKNFRSSDFPLQDSLGRRRLNDYIMDVVPLRGEHRAEALNIIKSIKRGETVILKPREKSQYGVVDVYSQDNILIGWLKAGDTLETNTYRSDIYHRLTDGGTVLAKAKNIRDGKTLELEIARYAIK